MAMNEILCVPEPFTISSSPNVSFPENLTNDRLGRTAIFPYFTQVTVDLGSVKPVDTFALLATNMMPGNFWRVFTSLTNNFDGPGGSEWTFDSYDTQFEASPEARRRLHRQGFILAPVGTMARYVKINVAGTPPTTIGRLIIGKRFTALDTMDIGYSYKVVDLGDKRRSSNMLDNNTIRGKVLEYTWTWSWMTEAEARGSLLDLLAIAGITRPILCILNPDAPDLHNVIGYGPLVEEGELRNVAGGDVDNAYEARFRLESKLILNL